MEKDLYLLVSILLLSFISCTDELHKLESQQSQLLKQIVMTTQDFEPEADSRTHYQIADGEVQCTWGSNDTVGVFPDKGAQAYFPMTTGAGTKNATFDGEGWALKDGYTYGAYYPFIPDILLDRNAVPVSYAGQTQVGNASMAHLGTYDYMVATPSAPEFGSAQFTFKHLSALVQLKLTVPQPTTFTSITLSTDNEVFSIEGKIDIMDSTLGIKPTTCEKEIKLEVKDVITTDANQVVTFYMMLPPVDLNNKTLKAIVKKIVSTEEVILESKNFQAGKAYTLSGSMKDPYEGSIDGNGSYKNGVVSITTAGTMKNLLDNAYLDIPSLKVIGPINGDDISCLRQMLGGSEFDQSVHGILTTLDLSEATILEGGNCYYDDTYQQFYPSNNIIGKRMFASCKLHNILLPNNIVAIDDFAFDGCSLIRIDIPDSVTSIGERAFSDCYSLTSATIGNSVSSISDFMFADCSSLTSVAIGKNVTSIGSCAFMYTSLKSMDIPDNVTSIGYNAFGECDSLTSVIIGNGVTSIGGVAFQDCESLAFVTIGNSVTLIAERAFISCSSLASIKIPDSVTLIGESAFKGCVSLSSAILGCGIVSIDEYAFDYCPLLSKVYCYATNPPELGYFWPFKDDGNKTLYVPNGCVGKYQSSDWRYYFKNIEVMNF